MHHLFSQGTLFEASPESLLGEGWQAIEKLIAWIGARMPTDTRRSCMSYAADDGVCLASREEASQNPTEWSSDADCAWGE